MPDTIDNQLESLILNPQSSTADGVSISERSISDLIAGDQYISGKRIKKQKYMGLQFRKLRPPTAHGDSVVSREAE